VQGTTTLLTTHEMAYALDIHPCTLEALVNNGIIPHTYIQPPGSDTKQVRFNPYSVVEWLQSEPQIKNLTGKNYLDGLRKQYKTYSPTIRALKNLNAQFAPKRAPKGYSLSKVPSKKYGFLYYVRYIRNGKLIPSRWNTHTNNLKAAEQFARNNRGEILTAYDAGRTDYANSILRIMETYYEKDSEYLEDAMDLGRNFSDRTRANYLGVVKNEFVPFLKARGVKCYADITLKIITKFRIHLRRKGNKPQSVNKYFGAIRTMFDHLMSDGVIPDNITKKVKALDEEKYIRQRGCYEISKLYGIFKRKWRDEIAYLLCLIIYSTGLRNSEIENITLQDIIKIKTCRFINVKTSKTVNGVRIVPLHPLVYQKIITYAKKNAKTADETIFCFPGRKHDEFYKRANLTLGKRLRMTEANLEAENITFYSGRHYWKTLMNAHELGDIEEIFMGHKVSADVAKRYNHRDKQGQQLVLKKAREVFAILDKTLFKQRS